MRLRILLLHFLFENCVYQVYPGFEINAIWHRKKVETVEPVTFIILILIFTCFIESLFLYQFVYS